MKQRLFIAIPLNNSITNKIRSFQYDNTQLENIRWLPPENLHITGCFIGDTEREVENDIKPKIEQTIRGIRSFYLSPDDFIKVPANKPKMIWLTFRDNPEFNKLHESLHDQLGLNEQKKPPKPHVTVARSKGKKPFKGKLKGYNASIEDIEVNSVELWESQLSERGAIYKRIDRFPFDD
ncbi:MAG: RNA 2',3'-cyclic phosphodiesterase [Flavobacteriales bacterium]